ncbi:hypothetical protein Q1695_007491 [Nippostrongylus brasiliensis]|nr:hypothetical protein Q1695_007491 [Nippostrongylus brasiliensis]
MSGGGIKDIYHFVEENLTELGLLPTRHPHWIIYCYFLVAVSSYVAFSVSQTASVRIVNRDAPKTHVADSFIFVEPT